MGNNLEQHKCEVRWLIQYERNTGRMAALAFLDLVKKVRDEKAYKKLSDDFVSQKIKGNKGNKGEWHDDR